MDTNRCIQKRILVGESNSSIELRRTIPVPDGDHRRDTSFPRARDYLLAVRVELLAIEMCVRIYEHG